eukprot:GEMP01022291.1.p1 GENE.GEMP01022291.1~~GEMP01022291.1.p1  ORF type:complete len:270 (-),score=33.17 GEMP01022291.1:1582-2391(-)
MVMVCHPSYLVEPQMLAFDEMSLSETEPSDRLVLLCNERAYKSSACQSQLEFLKTLENTKVVAIKKAYKLIRWLQTHSVGRPCYIICSWREGRLLIEQFELEPNLVQVLHLIIVGESSKQVHVVQRWLENKRDLQFKVDVAEEDVALQMLQYATAQHVEENVPFPTMTMGNTQIPEPLKIPLGQVGFASIASSTCLLPGSAYVSKICNMECGEIRDESGDASTLRKKNSLFWSFSRKSPRDDSCSDTLFVNHTHSTPSKIRIQLYDSIL